VLELVDGPRDLKFEMAARATGWDVLSSRLKTRSPRALVEGGMRDVEETIERERARALAEGGKGKGVGEGELRQRTTWNLRKALRYRSSEDVRRFGDKVQEHMVRLRTPPGPAHARPQGAHMTIDPYTDALVRIHSLHGLWPSKPSASTKKEKRKRSLEMRTKSFSAASKITN